MKSVLRDIRLPPGMRIVAYPSTDGWVRPSRLRISVYLRTTDATVPRPPATFDEESDGLTCYSFSVVEPLVEAPVSVLPGSFTEVQASRDFSWNELESRSPDTLLHDILDLVYTLWSHELDEWLTYKGKHVREPHPKDDGLA